MEDVNQEKNKKYYENIYSQYSIVNTLIWINDLNNFLSRATKTETSWFALYQNNFKDRINGKTVLEMGCGDCTNAAIMAALGAKVYANDIAPSSAEIIKRLNANFDFKFPIHFVEGDFLKNTLPSQNFDFIIGKAFLHHLTLPVEKMFIEESSRLLKPDGEALFFEPAVNSKILDEIRWILPVSGRPSKLNTKAFKKWKEQDPHPNRSFSSKHWEALGKNYFNEIQIVPVGTLERFSRWIKRGTFNIIYRQWSLKNEKKLPKFLNKAFARSQLIIYKYPKNSMLISD